MYQLINVNGSDTESFLQGQLTQDVERLTRGETLRSACCNPKGRVITTMTLIRSDNGIDMLLPAGMAETFLQRLSLYKLRAKVELALARNWQSVTIQSDADRQRLDERNLLPTTAGACCRDGHLTAVCIATDPVTIEILGASDAIHDLSLHQTLNADQQRTSLIHAGLVQINVDSSEKYTPHMLSLDLAGAVSFDKGCYTGQEVVARTEHRGRSRRRLAHYHCDTQGLAAGDELLDEKKVVGTVVNASGSEVLAVAPVDLQGAILNLNGEQAHPVALPW